MNTRALYLSAFLLPLLNSCGDEVSINKAETVALTPVEKQLPNSSNSHMDYPLYPKQRLPESISSKKKLTETKQKAEAGDAKAQRNLAIMYGRGIEVPNDNAKAMEWLQKAAVKGDADAQTLLGWMYDSGGGIPKDWVKAIEWYQKAAEQGDVDAQLNLGMMYADGRGVSKDINKAVEWFQKAAAQGDVIAEVFLGETPLDDRQ